MKKALIFLFLLPFLYWVPVNAGLALKLIPHFASSGKGKSFNVDYAWAWSLFPGVVHVRKLHLDGTDRNVYWEVNLDRLTFRHGFKALFHRVLEVHRLDGDGVTVGVRQHREVEKPEVRKRLGPDQPVRESDPLPWRVSISNIRLRHLTQAHLDQLRFTGESEVDGEFMLLPGRRLEISPSQWKIEDGTFLHGEDRILIEVRGSSTVTIHPTDLIHTHGSQIFKTMDIVQHLVGKIPRLTPFRGKIHASFDETLDMKSGKFKSGSKLKARLASDQDSNWKMNIRIEKMDFNIRPRLHIDGTLNLAMNDLKFPLRLLVPDTFWIKVGTFLFPMNDFKGSGLLQVDGDGLTVRKFRAKASSGTIDGAWALLSKAPHPQMAFLFTLGLMKLCVSQKKNQHSPDVAVFTNGTDCEKAIKNYNERRN